MKLLVFGSLNIDHTYRMPHLVQAGETLASAAYTKNVGGKGFNQASALAKAGQAVHFAGAIGQEGLFLRDYLADLGVAADGIRILDVPTGHAIIQVDEQGQNAIILFGGANQAITEAQIEETLAKFSEGDYLLLQNEISLGETILRRAHEKGMCIILNPSPITPDLLNWPLGLVDWLILNEIEGHDLTGQTEPDMIISVLQNEYHIPHIVLTLGEKGACYADDHQRIHQAAILSAPVVDTTAAGDTFTGYFLTAILSGCAPAQALRKGAAAASIAISRPGAADSIPYMDEVP